MISSHFHRSNDFVEHHRINYEDNLYYMDNQPYPYLDSIILYHQRHKLNGIKLTYHVCYRLWKGFVYNLMNALFCLLHSVFPMQCFDQILLFTWSGSNVSTDVPSLVRTGDLKFRKETNKYQKLENYISRPIWVLVLLKHSLPKWCVTTAMCHIQTMRNHTINTTVLSISPA